MSARGALAPALAVLLIVLAAAPAQARTRHRGPTASDPDRTLARMAARDRLVLWPAWERSRPLASYLPPLTRERVAAAPFTGWGYGGTIPGAWPGF